jgi:hypothetical protein
LYDDQGNPFPLPAPKGISGGGVWRIARPNLPTGEWAPDDFKLVAIERCLLPDTGALLATRLEYALALLRKHHPELDSAFRLSLPGLG